MEKNIIIIGCGDSGSVAGAIARINEHVKREVPAVFHMTPPDISKDDLQALALSFQKQDMEVLIISDGLDIAKELIPEPSFAERMLIMEMPKMTDYTTYDEPRNVNPSNRGHKGKKKYWNKRGK